MNDTNDMHNDNITPQKNSSQNNAAVELIRHKLDNLYQIEPDAQEEEAEAEAVVANRSKHQEFIYSLNHSGKSLAEIQTAWHEYYIALPDTEKHVVWQEFYAAHAQASEYMRNQNLVAAKTRPPYTAIKPHQPAPDSPKISTNPAVTVQDIKQQLRTKVAGRAKLQRKHHYQSLIFGLSIGSLTIFILLFSFFNERFIAPFITPSRSVSATPIIIDANNTAVGKDSKLIIPKINVELPVIYDEGSIEDNDVENALESGVLHYPTTSYPGQLGNGAIFGHSSNNILNKGKYKFAFVILKRLENGDLFYIQKDGKRYVYRVFDKKIVKPEQIAVMNDSEGKRATFALITCDPPGTSINRLVVLGEQISPDPNLNMQSTASKAPTIKQLPSNAPSLWSRVTHWFTN
ncbi:MAG: hypothetical protein NVSMB46_07930 [Candidatus Saccharimonadales bacterium]